MSIQREGQALLPHGTLLPHGALLPPPGAGRQAGSAVDRQADRVCVHGRVVWVSDDSSGEAGRHRAGEV